MRRKKANAWDLYHAGISWFMDSRVTNSKGVKGWRYVLSSPLTESQRESLSKWKNVIVSECHHRYAPEIVHTTIILTDKMVEVAQ